MPTPYTVNQGDCISSIAADAGLEPHALWNHSDNADLKNLRKDPNALAPGDTVNIPDRELKTVDAASNKRHQFKRKGVPAILHLCLKRDNHARANLKYDLIVDGIISHGTTDGDGVLKAKIAPNAKEAIVRLHEKKRVDEYRFNLGHVDPIDTDKGVTDRLRSLGYSTSGGLPPAISAFQKDVQLQVTGRMDDATRNKLKEKYGQ